MNSESFTAVINKKLTKTPKNGSIPIKSKTVATVSKKISKIAEMLRTELFAEESITVIV